MKYFIFKAAGILLAILLALSFFQVGRFFWFTRQISYDQRPFERIIQNAKMRVLVLGDSTAVGTGTLNNEGSVAGWFGRDFPDAEIENHAQNGLKTGQVLKTFDLNFNKKYDLVLLQAGANDILRFTPLDQLDRDLTELLSAAKRLGRQVAILHSGNIGSAPIFIWPFSVLYTHQSRRVRDLYLMKTKAMGVVYIDLYQALIDDILRRDIGRYYAKDYLHLSEEGYFVWYTTIRKTLAKTSVPGRLIDGTAR